MTGELKNPFAEPIEITSDDIKKVCPNIAAVEEPFEKVLYFDVMKYEYEAGKKWYKKHLNEKHGGEIDQTGCFIRTMGVGYKFVRTSVGSLVFACCDFCEESELVTEP